MKTCPVCDSDYPDQHNTCPTDGAVLIVSHELEAGALVRGKYRIVSKLGQGGMGVVYLAEHILLGGNVALKFLAGDLGKDPKFIKRFRMEARAAHQLRHPNIVEVTDLDQSEDGSLFIAMEYVAGKSLRAVIDEERSGLGVQRALELTRGIVSGLAAAHAQGTVHRDVKPENILLAHTADGRELPKVLDFGIAAMAESATVPNMTRGLLLTPGYAAPEQWKEMPAAEMDGRTDLYAMGCVFYEMLTGHTPFTALNMDSCRRQHMEETPKPPSELRPELANWTGLDGLVMRMLAKNRDDRPKDAEALSLLDGVQPAPGITQRTSGKEWQKTVAVSDWNRPQTISEGSQGWQKVASTPVPQQASQAPQQVSQAQQPASQTWQPVSHVQQSVSQAPQQVIAQKPAQQNIPVWVWGIVAIPVLAMGIAAVWLFMPKPQPPNTISTTQTNVAHPLLAGANTSTAHTQPSQNSNPTYTAPNSSQKPSPSSNANTSSSTDKPTYADNRNTPIVQHQVIQPQVVNPPAQKPSIPDMQPSISDITKMALALYGQKNYSMAAPLLDKACTGGSGEACKDLGNLYHDGNGVPKRDGSRAVALYSKACSTSPPMGCNSLGVMYHNGDSVPPDDTRAANLYSQACNAGDALGCTNLGNSYWNGKGVPHDDAQAATLYSRACNSSNGAGCSSLGLCYLTGRGVGKNYDNAKQYFTTGCKMGNKWGCDQLSVLK
jgi:serine/threonine protein kinase